MVKNPADFVGSVLGGSEQNTKGILASTAGKVLVIDEAYGLLGGSTEGGGPQSDPYKQAVIDTIGKSMPYSLCIPLVTVPYKKLSRLLLNSMILQVNHESSLNGRQSSLVA